MNLTTRLRGHLNLARVREEHDQWAATATPGTYYSAAPTHRWTEGGTHFHSVFPFTEKGRGFYKGQMVTDRGRSSWSLWQEFGPFTATKKTTAADCAAADAAAEAGAMRRAEQAVAVAAGWDREWAELAQQYPESVRALQAA